MNKSEKIFPYFMTLPLSIYIIFILLGSLAMSFLQSLGYSGVSDLNNINFNYYKEIILNIDFINSLVFSLYTSFVSAFISVLIGVLIAFMALNLKKEKLLSNYYEFSIAIPHMVFVLMISSIFAKTGIISRFINLFNPNFDFGIFPSFIYNKRGFGIIMAYVWKQIPFIAMTSYSIFTNIDSSLKDIAINLGASKFQFTRYILLPLSSQTIFFSFLIILSYSFGAYEIPFLLGPTSPKALPVKAFIEYTNPLLSNRPYAMVYNILIFLINAIMIFSLLFIFNYFKRKRRGKYG